MGEQTVFAGGGFQPMRTDLDDCEMSMLEPLSVLMVRASTRDHPEIARALLAVREGIKHGKLREDWEWDEACEQVENPKPSTCFWCAGIHAGGTENCAEDKS